MSSKKDIIIFRYLPNSDQNNIGKKEVWAFSISVVSTSTSGNSGTYVKLVALIPLLYVILYLYSVSRTYEHTYVFRIDVRMLYVYHTKSS